ncbi:MAG: phenylacetate-CoA oxygenase subunit PaaJ [Bacteroidetes bacterium]|nr:phenylacetate-CoA oxygenase subunit PaaJ [Bacteroidota bacterium]MBS1541785.1 phenylacetate-CoA oxygenase subunit PaaJ [Bacteroidota bacterium]
MTREEIIHWLDAVKDPEIPVLSLVDLGVITDVVIEADQVTVDMTPTFVGCPAIDYMKEEVLQLLQSKGLKNIKVNISFKRNWSSDMISEKGKTALKKFGLSPPPPAKIFTDLEVLEHAICPRCDSSHTELKSPFGSTLCRSIYYCYDCKEAFEQFKPL